MRIGLLSFELTSNGGEQRQLLRLADELQARGHHVWVHAYRYNPAACYPTLTGRLDIRCVERLRADRLAGRSTALGTLASAVKRYSLESRRLARFLARVDVLNPHGRPAHRAAVLSKRRTGAPIVWTCNDIVSWEEPGHRARLPAVLQSVANRVMLPLERRIVRQIDRIAVLDKGSQEILRRTYGRPTRLVRTGLDTGALQESPSGRQRIRRLYGIADRDYLVLWLGVLDPFRRLEDLLEALRHQPEPRIPMHVLIVGRQDVSPGYAQRLKQLITERGLDPLVRLVPGSIPDKELADYYSACDVFVFPNDHQAWGLAPLEALSCRRPVIVSRGSGVHEVLTEGETALLVPPRDPAAIARALRTMRENPALASRLARQGRAWVEKEFSWGRYASHMVELFEEALEAAGRRREPVPARNSSEDEEAAPALAPAASRRMS
jgi:glycosyltransferase involved in cell wall biosynthesis